jgi:hypothetical protein
MRIADNGRGIASPEDVMARGHGLAGMRHRIAALGGRWQIMRRETGGTEIRVDVPLAQILAGAEPPATATPAAAPTSNVQPQATAPAVSPASRLSEAGGQESLSDA